MVNEIAAQRLCPPKALSEMLAQWDYTASLTCTYFILLERKHKGQTLTSPAAAAAARMRVTSPMRELDPNVTPKRSGGVPAALKDVVANSLGDSPRGLHNSLEGGLDDLDLLTIGKQQQQTKAGALSGDGTPKLEQQQQQAANFDRSKNRASERYHIPNKKRQQQELAEGGDKENRTPVRKSNPPMANSPLSPSRSVDSGLNNSGAAPGVGGPRTPKSKGGGGRDWVFATPERPSSGSGGGGLGSGKGSSKNVLGSIERGLDKMKNMLTPRRSRHSSSDPRPALVTGKALCNVSTTSHHNPDTVLTDLTRALVSKGIPCQQKGYILRGKIRDASGYAKLSFELEVCRIPNLNVVGIRRKRLKGDAWCYKKVCEEVLRMAAVGKNQGASR